MYKNYRNKVCVCVCGCMFTMFYVNKTTHLLHSSMTVDALTKCSGIKIIYLCGHTCVSHLLPVNNLVTEMQP